MRAPPRRERVPGRGQARAQPAPRVEQVLVDGVAVGAQLQREHVDRHVVERDRHEHLALARRQVLARSPSRSAASCSRRSARSPGLPPARPGSCSQRAPRRSADGAARRAGRPCSETSKITNLYAQVVKRLSPRKSSSLARMFTSASSAHCCATSSNSGPASDASWPRRRRSSCSAARCSSLVEPATACSWRG